MQKSADITDSLFSYALKQLARLTLIAKKEYENAIDQFDDIVQQLPERFHQTQDKGRA